MVQKTKKKESAGYVKGLGKIPAWITHWGMAVIILLIVGVLAGAFLIKSPETVQGPFSLIRITHSEQAGAAEETLKDIYGTELPQVAALMFISEEDFRKIEPGQSAILKLNSYPYMEFGFLSGTVHGIAQSAADGSFLAGISIEGPLETNNGQKVDLLHSLDGFGEITVGDKRLAARILQPMKNMLNQK